MGAKTELFGGRLTGSMSLYQLTKQNVLATDPVHGSPFVVPLGKVRDRGFEMDVSGEILPRWNVILTYSYIDARTTKADPVELLGRTAGVPHNSGSVWNTYAFEGALSGLTLGGGVEANSSQLDFFQNRLPGYVTASLFASYKFRVAGQNLSAQLNIRNMFDKKYYASTDNIPGEPRSAVATLRVVF